MPKAMQKSCFKIHIFKEIPTILGCKGVNIKHANEILLINSTCCLQMTVLYKRNLRNYLSLYFHRQGILNPCICFSFNC